MRKTIFIKLFFFVLVFIVASCTSTNIPLYEYPPDWKEVSVRDSTIKNYSKYLEGKKIFIDPGHGGEDRKNGSYDRNIIEADVNLHVALDLRDYLRAAGAEVVMSRDMDMTVPLAMRSELANNSGADLFLSIHHNATAQREDNYTNYTSVYYHALKTDYEYEPCTQDLARYIERDLSYVMGNPSGLGSFDGTLSDYRIYPGEGFSVLRKTKIPGVLVECAFHTSRFEELRLNDKTFNEIQAWGIFRGLAKYFRAGIPQIEYLPDSTKIEIDNTILSFSLNDPDGIDVKSITVYIDEKDHEFNFNTEDNVLTIKINNTEASTYLLRILCANKNENHSLPYHKNIKVYIDKTVSVDNF